ncbi:calcium-binding protein [Ensifer aridi]|uniref:calcium-binding protein n=1 Tax=Ensifer aridi TaxID=1708715 RepID=UPI001556F1C2|nr:calcium-binding protein [Ensifer aridi]
MTEFHAPSSLGKILDKMLNFGLEQSGYKNDFVPESSEEIMKQGFRDLEKSQKADDIIAELKKEYPNTPFNEGAVRQHIYEQYDAAIKQQDIRYGGTVNPDGSVNSEGLKWRMDDGFEDPIFDDLQDKIGAGEFPPDPGGTDPGGTGPGGTGPGGTGPGGTGPGGTSPGGTDPGGAGPGGTDPGGAGPGGTAPANGWPPAPPAPPRDPLVLDLDGDGVELISLASSAAHFDYERDGFAEKTGWLSSDDAFLIHDDNGNGRVDGITELFGSPTEDGFSALRAFDTNNDGNVDANDNQFSNLKLWRDLNGNGTSEEGEMFALSEYHVASIGVEAAPTTRVTAGNMIAFEGRFTRSDGSTGQAEAVLFETNPTVSRWIVPEGFQVSDSARLLPNLKGYGLLPDLAYSMTLNDDLRVAVQSLVLDTLKLPAGQLRAKFESLLQTWAGVTNVPVDDRGEHIDAKIVAFMEKYFASELAVGSDRTITARFADVINANYDTVVDVLFTRFLSQAHVSAFDLGVDPMQVIASPFISLAPIDYNHDSDSLEGSIDRAVELAIAIAPVSDNRKLDYYSKVVSGFLGFKYEYFSNDNAKFKAYILPKLVAAESDNVGLLAFIEAYLDTGKLIGGTSEADALVGTSANSVVMGGHGNDALNGGAGSDTYVYARGDGNDTIVEATNQGSNDQLVLTDINPADVTLVRNGSDVTLVIAESTPGAGDAGSILLKNTLDDYYGQGVEKVVFADGTTWTRAQLRDMLLTSTAADETFNGFSGSDAFRYSRGDGHDTIIEATNAGSDDRLLLTDINPAEVSLVRNGNHVTLVIAESTPGAGDGGSVLLKDTLDDYYGQGVEKVVFADGTTWTRAQIRTMLLQQASTAGNDTINGFNVADTLTGGHGSDTINGAAGDDTYVYAHGDGNDTITEGTNQGSNDRLLLTDINRDVVTLVRNGNDVTIVIAESTPGAGDAGSVLLKNTLNDYYGQGVDKVVFADGTTWNRAAMNANVDFVGGTNGNDTIIGTSGNDTILADLGNDTIITGAGNDVIVFKPNFGMDTITDFKAGAGTDDVLEFDSTLFADFESVLAAASQVGSDTVIAFDAANTVTLKNVTLANLHADDVRFLA